MKRRLLSLFIVLALAHTTSAQYTASISHTAEELVTELAGDGIVVLNPVLTCRDSFSAIFSGTGDLGFNNGIILSTLNAPKIFTPYDVINTPLLVSTYEIITSVGAEDKEMNDLLDNYDYPLSVAFNTCSIDIDVVPQAKNLKMDFVFTSNTDGGLRFCEPVTDYIAVLIYGGEYTDTTNLATFPETDIPVNTWTLTADSTLLSTAHTPPSSCDYIMGEEMMPFDDYQILNHWGDYTTSVHYPLLSTVIPITASVSPCDTYHLKIAIADVRMPGGYDSYNPSSFFLKSGSLRTTGQPEDCPTMVDPDPPTGINEYLKQQAAIKVSPNPFNSGMAISIKNDNGKDIYHVGLYDMGGRKLQYADGNLDEVNARLSSIGNKLATGLYYLKIQSASGRYHHTVKVVKE
jgi:hypothetical protein